MARPRKYNKKQLKTAVDAYFRGISRTEVLRDPNGDTILSDAGEPIMVTNYLVPPSISGMCIKLGIDRSTFQNYADARLYPDLAPIIAEAKGRIEAYLEEQLLVREKGLHGIIFNLQNNYGWREKKEVELGEKTRTTVAVENLSSEEKMAFLREVMAGGDPDEKPDDR